MCVHVWCLCQGVNEKTCLLRVQEAMSALTNELQIRQGTIGELRASMEDVSMSAFNFSVALTLHVMLRRLSLFLLCLVGYSE